MIELLSNTGYIVVNKTVIKKLGIHEALLLGEICSEYSYWKRENRLDEQGYFYSTRENIEENTGLSAFQQRKAMNHLIEKCVIQEISKGMPARNWYIINENKLEELFKEAELEKVLTTSDEETSHQEVENFDNKASNNLITSDKEILQHDIKKFNTNNNNIILINNNNNQSILSKDGDIGYERLFKDNIEYETLKQDCRIAPVLEDITKISIDVLNSNKELIMINCEPKNIDIVKSQLLKLKSNHIQYVIDCLNKNRNDIKNVKAYTITTLYNSLLTSNLDITLQVSRIMNCNEGCGVI